MGAVRGAAPAWRSACLVLCLLPVVLPLVLLWLPLLCVAVAVVRFRRRRRRLMMATRRGRCSFGGGEGSTLEAVGAEHRAALLHKYLEDQMELVGADAQAEAGDAGTPPWIGGRAPNKARGSNSMGARNRRTNWAQETELAELGDQD
ncbi:uncharacterized protein LOC133900477 [Phragmites australis]|uniref:uncharacterized protein LOC133900477 n=1 Tax=Phragmites australis TaxID=29695 RepID=UPI002D77A582|nr:uncharacterized protein LOC133900477 [Phragmites australis]